MITKRPRTADSVVWNGTRACDLISNVRFSWDKYQTRIFEDFLRTVGLNFKNCDITPLLVKLNLDGYEDIENDDGDNVHDIIEVKVQRKLRNMADEMDEEILRVASMGPKEGISSNKHDYSQQATEEKLSPAATNKAAARGPMLDFAAPIKEEDPESSELTLHSRTPIQAAGAQRVSRSDTASPPRLLHPSPKMPRSPPATPPTQRYTSYARETPPTRSDSRDRAMHRLARSLSRLSAGLEDIKSAIDDVETDEGPEWDRVVGDLSLGIHDIKIDVSDLRELVNQKRYE